ncbi:deoxyribonuclease-2-beta-like [Scomber scombrus]|uniref:Deoxyribonuclease-2-alpha n=1 Tax=Scomber scombrus TaxID=13677 RepID=A0AAV1QDB1_SCOSC
MWRLVLVVSLLCCSSEASVSCRDEKNNEVDWYILYKTPKSQENQLTGLDYVYIYPDNNNKVKSRLNTKPINDPNGILANTLRQHLDFNEASPTPNFGFISYSDQPPKDVKPRPGHSHGHSKGVVMMEKDKTGLWLLHSTPQFPQKGQHFYPESGSKKGQTFICVTFNYDQFKAIGTHLQYINAFPYHQHIPPDFHVELQQPKPGEKRKIIDISNEFQELKSSNNKAFNSIAKQVSETGDPEVGDLYVTISKAVDSDVRVQTWGCQAGHDHPFCPTSGKKVQNIQSVQPDSNWKEWRATVDHSKWCVAMDQNKPWTCIADVNRSKSQYGRPGGALCVKDEDIANIFRTFVKSVDDCSGRGKRDDESCPDPDPDSDLDPEPQPDLDIDPEPQTKPGLDLDLEIKFTVTFELKGS